MFSSRLHWDTASNRISAALAAHQGRILDLTESNPTHAGLDYAPDLASALADPGSLSYDPAATGLCSARQAVSEAYERRGVVAPADRLVLSTSTSESYSWLFKLLADPGDEVLVPRPSYPLFEFLAALECAKVVQYPLHYHGCWAYDLHELERLATPRTRAVVLVNPNNPTGSYLKRAEFERLAAFCADRGLAIVSDEVFADYAFGPDPDRVTTLAAEECPALVFSLGGLSKMAGLPQMKLGWMLAGGPEPLRRSALERLELIADTYLSVSTPVQLGAPRLIEEGERIQSQIRERTAANLAWLRGALRTAPACELLGVEGGWYAILRVPRTRSEEAWVLELLERDGVLLQPGFFYDFESEAYLVASLLTRTEVFRPGIELTLKRVGAAL